VNSGGNGGSGGSAGGSGDAGDGGTAAGGASGSGGAAGGAGTAGTGGAPFDPAFILGADISSVQESQSTFRDTDGQTKSIFEVLKNHGFNYIRLKTFVDPSRLTGTRRPRTVARASPNHSAIAITSLRLANRPKPPAWASC
jgi:hypothetical protein